MTNLLDLEPIREDAIAWAVRVRDPAFDDWEGFEAWLNADLRHAAAYHDVCAAEADMIDLLAAAPAPEAPQPVAMRPATRRWAIAAGGALAASIIGIVAYWGQLQPAPIVYETTPGSQRSIALDDGSRVILNGDTRLEARRDDPRTLALVRGEALFTVRHDAARPFRVTIGDASVVDVGTRFSIVRGPGERRVAVSEGAVDWQQQGATVRVAAGRRLRLADGSSDIELGDVAPDAVGGWSQGQLSFDGVPLSEAAADLSRTLGTTVKADAAVAGKPVRATIRLDGSADQVVQRFALLTGVHAARDGKTWRLIASQ